TARFAFRGNLFKDFNTRFNRREFSNFAIWPYKTKLWDKTERTQVIPTLYIPVVNDKLVRTLSSLSRYDLVTIEGVVHNDYANLPWIEVTKMKPVSYKQVTLKDTVLSHIRNGLELEKGAKHSLAAEEMEMALKDGVPEEYLGLLYHHLGLNYHADNQLSLAAGAFAKSTEYDNSNVPMLLEKAEVHLKLTQPEAALAACNQVLKRSADYPLVHALMGEAYGLLGQGSKGLKLCLLASNSPGVTAEVKAKAEVHRARVYVSSKRYREAVGAYAKAIGFKSPLATKAWLRKEIGRFYEARYNETSESRYLDEAITEYSNACNLTQNRDVEAIHLQAAALYAKARQANSTDLQAVTSLLELIDSLDPSYIPAQILAGKVAFTLNQPDKAKAIYQRIAAENPGNAEVQIELAGVYERLKDIPSAIAAYQKAVALNPTHIKGWRKVATLSETVGDLAVARDAYASLSKLSPVEPQYRVNLSRLALATNSYETAIVEGQKAIALMGSAKEAGPFVAAAYQASGDLVSAERALRDVLSADPANKDAAVRLARVLADQDKDLNYAMSLVKDGAKGKAAPLATREVYGWVVQRLGDSGQAVKVLSGIPADQRSRAAWYYLGAAYASAGKPAESVSAFEKVINRPVQKGELRGIAEQLVEKARMRLPEAKVDMKEARRRNQIIEREEQRAQLALDLERRRLAELARIEEKAKAEAKALKEEAGGTPAPVLEEKDTAQPSSQEVEVSKTKAMAAPEGESDPELLDPSKVFIDEGEKDASVEEAKQRAKRTRSAIILSSVKREEQVIRVGNHYPANDGSIVVSMGDELELLPELDESYNELAYIRKSGTDEPKVAAAAPQVMVSISEDEVAGGDDFRSRNEVMIAPEWVD
ncbi:MAG: tetratricopeptide repeat protein, partial [Planctomycetota bacterium]